MDRDSALQTVRVHFEKPIWALLGQIEGVLVDLANVRHFELSDPRAIGAVVNHALTDALAATPLASEALTVRRCENGQSNKLTGTIVIDGEELSISFELHLSGPRGGTSKAAHQFAGHDIEREPTFPGFDREAPPSILLFIAYYLSGTGRSVERAFLKFADTFDQRKIEIHRDILPSASGIVDAGPVDGPAGATVRLKKAEGAETGDGSKTAKRRHAAPR